MVYALKPDARTRTRIVWLKTQTLEDPMNDTGCLYCNGGVVTVRCTNNAGNANSRNHAERCGANSISVQGFGILAGWLAANNGNQLGPVSSTNTPR